LCQRDAASSYRYQSALFLALLFALVLAGFLALFALASGLLLAGMLARQRTVFVVTADAPSQPKPARKRSWDQYLSVPP